MLTQTQTQKQLIAAQKINLAAFFNLAGKIVGSVEKLTELNSQAIRSTLSDAQDRAQHAWSNTTTEWPLQPFATIAPDMEKAQAYSRRLLEIATTTQADLVQAMLAQWEAYRSETQSLIEDTMKNSPAGSQAIAAALDSAITAANVLAVTLQKTGEQAAEATQAGFDMAASAAAKTARQAGAAAAASKR